MLDRSTLHQTRATYDFLGFGSLSVAASNRACCAVAQALNLQRARSSLVALTLLPSATGTEKLTCALVLNGDLPDADAQGHSNYFCCTASSAPCGYVRADRRG